MKPITTEQAIAEAGRKERRAHQIERDNKVQRAFQIIEAAANDGRPCPTNRDLSDMLGYAAPNKACGVVNLLEATGIITVKRGQKSRVVTIVKTGRKTAGPVPIAPAKGWTEDDDAILMDGIAEGGTFKRVAEILHKTENACTLRFHRIAASMGAQAA